MISGQNYVLSSGRVSGNGGGWKVDVANEQLVAMSHGA
jgi:hypothetical protein